ncbi:MAG: serine/threonine-protein kinase, partial [Myxococcota bacterium]
VGAARRLEAEGRALARVRHPNVVTVYDVGLHHGGVFVAMEFLAGQPLSSWITPRPSLAECRRVFAEAGRGLAAAHEVGIVHRDFKPANVMLEPEGRVVVLDFGLARLAAVPSSGAVESHSTSPDEPATNSVAGTPGYMAPEQINGDPVTELSDQFSFCVSLFEAVHGRRPFVGRHALELQRAMLDGVPGPLGADGVPRWLDKIVRRGLSAEPEQRFPSMHALVAALERADGQRRGVQVAAVGLGVLGSAAWAAAGTESVGPDVACVRDTNQALQGVWGPADAERVRAAFERSTRPHAVETGRRVHRRLDRYAAAWRASSGEACEATLVQGIATPERLSMRRQCLEAHARALSESVAVLQEAATDPEVVDHALTIVAGLASPRGCLGPDAGDAPAPEQRETTDIVLAEVARASARRNAGQHGRAAEILEQALGRAEPLGVSRALLAAVSERGRLRDARGQYAAALDDAAHALALATELDLPAEQADAAMTAMMLHGLRLAAYDEATRWETIARGVVSRLASDDLLRAKLLWFRGAVERRRGDAALAEDNLRRALAAFEAADADPLQLANLVLELAEALGVQAKHDEEQLLVERTLRLRTEALGAQHPGVADTLSSLAVAAGRQGRVDDAIALGRRALSLYELGVDPGHVNVGTILNNLGIEYSGAGRLDEAIEVLDRSLVIRTAAFGDAHEDVAETLSNRGWALYSAGRTADAQRDLERAVEIIEARKGPHAPDLAGALTNLGTVAEAEGDLELATQCQRRSLAVAVAVYGEAHPSVGVAHHNIGDLLAGQERCAEAIPHYERAIAIFEGAHGRQHTTIAYPATSLGRCYLDDGAIAHARELLERALAIRTAQTVSPQELGTTAMTLAHALWSDPSTRSSAQAMADRGLAAFEAAGPGGAQQLADARAWVEREL